MRAAMAEMGNDEQRDLGQAPTPEAAFVGIVDGHGLLDARRVTLVLLQRSQLIDLRLEEDGRAGAAVVTLHRP
jgi:hypothetical protein